MALHEWQSEPYISLIKTFPLFMAKLVKVNIVTGFIDISPLWQKFDSLFIIWQTTESSLAKL